MRKAIRSTAVFVLCLTAWAVGANYSEAAQSYPNHGQSFNWNGFRVFNNQWGKGFARQGGFQSIVRENDNTISFQYNWWNVNLLRADVKGYPAIIAGWHYGDPGGYMTPYVPVRINAEKAFTTGVKARHSNFNNGRETMNLSWDIWIAWNDQPSAPGNEVMVWPWKRNQRPIGSKVGSVWMWNAWWDFYSGQMSAGGNSWWVFTFVRQNDAYNGDGSIGTSGNLRDFINYVWKQKGWLNGNQWIVGIECGTEIVEGQGSWNIFRYWLNP